MARKSVVWTATAIRQRREILKYWTERNGSTTYARRLIYSIKSRIDAIVSNPFSGKTTNHPGTRESALGNFSLYYKIYEDQIIITAFWDNRQNPDTLLKLLQTQ